VSLHSVSFSSFVSLHNPNNHCDNVFFIYPSSTQKPKRLFLSRKNIGEGEICPPLHPPSYTCGTCDPFKNCILSVNISSVSIGKLLIQQRLKQKWMQLQNPDFRYTTVYINDWIQQTENNHIFIFRYATEFPLHGHSKNTQTTAHYVFVFVFWTGDTIV
jgi:hypothetical protein